MSNKRAIQQVGVYLARKNYKTAVTIPKRYYAQRIKKADISMGGIFEPFLDDKTSKKNLNQEAGVETPKELLLNKTVKDILPHEDILKAAIEHKQTNLSIENQKEITKMLLDCVKNDQPLTDNILKLADNKVSELSAFANILLRTSKYSAPLALELYKYTMENGDDRGAFSYANMIYRGYNGTLKNEQEGIKIMSSLAQKGHPYAQMNLAAILMRSGEQVNSAIKLYELAGKAGLDNAYTELGRMHRLGYGVHQDHAKAIEYFKKGAQSNNPQCHFMLGVYYSSGLGTSDKAPDQKKAFKHFQKAAIKGLPEAQYNVGQRFLKGHGCDENAYNAAEFFRMAASQGFQLAQVNLAGMYSEGRGVKTDFDEARSWLGKAVELGGPIGKDAQKRIDQLDEIQGKKRDGSRCNIM